MGHALVAAAAVVAAALVGLAVRRWLVFVTKVDSVSMTPTLLPGRYLVTRRPWRPERIRRGDVVVVDSQELGRTVVKRVLGLPGERVVIEPGGRISVDGHPVAEPYVVHAGGAYGVFRVPPGRVLLLGDNRARSSDSRTWRDPCLPVRAVRGTVLICPLGGPGPAPVAAGGTPEVPQQTTWSSRGTASRPPPSTRACACAGCRVRRFRQAFR